MAWRVDVQFQSSHRKENLRDARIESSESPSSMDGWVPQAQRFARRLVHSHRSCKSPGRCEQEPNGESVRRKTKQIGLDRGEFERKTMLTNTEWTGAGWRSARGRLVWCSCERQYKREVRHGVETGREIMDGFEVGLHAQVRLDCETRDTQRKREHANAAKSVQRDGFQAETLRLLIIAKPRRTMLRTTNKRTNCKT